MCNANVLGVDEKLYLQASPPHVLLSLKIWKNHIGIPTLLWELAGQPYVSHSPPPLNLDYFTALLLKE